MRVHVVIATRGRPRETSVLIDHLMRQTHRPDRVLVVGAERADVEGLDRHAGAPTLRLETLVGPRAGLPIQRNLALDHLVRTQAFAGPANASVAVFFDDDFRPDVQWLANAVAALEAEEGVVGLTGAVLADGIKGLGLSERDARDYLAGEKPAEPHWASGEEIRDVSSAYGCNMAFRGTVAAVLRFDERLPLYAWQEDCDYTGQALRCGRVIYAPSCKGVHLGIKSARTSGVKIGYSQIANPLYLMRKGTMGRSAGVRFLLRAIAANSVRSLGRHPAIDYTGRLTGNWIAVRDLALRRCRPERILDL